MIKNTYNVVGVMSGTSLDGVDLVYVKFQWHTIWKFDIVYTETVSYTPKWKAVLKKLVFNSVDELENIDVAYTEYMASVINRFIKKYNIKALDAICSHGHTALHRPENQLTYQIGNKPNLANLVNKLTVCDFRTQDVKLGGQGAPLVPIGDRLLFSDFDFCLNLGGFANISTTVHANTIAFDICPVNIVLNHYVKLLGFDYDDKGNIATSGRINNKLLEALNALGFYQEKHPKSLGLEWVNTHVFPLIDSYNLEIKDILRTCVEHMAIQIASEINKKNKGSVLVTGGGAYNNFLIKQLKHHSKNDIIIPSNSIVEFKEALIFGFLGVLKLRNEINCLKRVTGASKNHSSGKIYYP